MQNKRLSPSQKVVCAKNCCCLSYFLFAYFYVFVSSFLLVSVFVRAKSFCKKKIKRLKIVLIVSINFTTYSMQNSSLFFQGYVLHPPSAFKTDVDQNSDVSSFTHGKVKTFDVRYPAILVDIIYGSEFSNSIVLARCTRNGLFSFINPLLQQLV